MGVIKMWRKKIKAGVVLGTLVLAGAGLAAASETPLKLELRQGWALQSSARVREGGETLSRPQFAAPGWYPTQVPATVLAALAANAVYPDPYYGRNLAQIPGNFPFPLDVSSLPQKPGSPFLQAWWYRTEFALPADYQGKTIWLHLNGINFRGNLWLNGKQVADANELAGTFRLFEFNITDFARPGQANALAIEVFPPLRRDLAFTWVDWNPAPPDRNMGLWREVYITASGPVSLRHPFVKTELDLPSLETARLTVLADARNASEEEVSGTLAGRIGEISFAQPVTLQPGETRTITFSAGEFSQLAVSKPRVWWPDPLGPQNLYDLILEFEAEGSVSDRQTLRFGIRQVTSELTPEGHRVFLVNGRRILIRGAGWAPDLMFRSDPERLAAEIRYVKEMNLNTIRLEGKLEFDRFYELCDEQGILVMAGWCCCHHWERWGRWDEEDYRVAEASERDQALRLRSHPSLLAWLNGSDNPPPPKVEKMYLQVLEAAQWPNPVISSATETPTPVTGPSGVKMTGPYEWVPPGYWLADTRRGGAFGFNTETSPGPAVPPVESLRLMLPPDRLWPINRDWNYHAGRGFFANVRVFSHALEARYGPATGVEDYAKKAQAMTYEAERAMFEAYGRNKYLSTGVIQWMLNNAWPGLIWHLYDYYLRPGGGYFGAQRAGEPLHVQYSYDDRSIAVVNSRYREYANLKVTAKVLNLDLAEKWSQAETITVPADASVRAFTVPESGDFSKTYFLRLELTDAEGKTLSSNFYWLSTLPEVLAWRRSNWFYTPARSFADFTGLEKLPAVELKVASAFETSGQETSARVTVENPGPHLAFMVHLKIVKGPAGEEVLPVFWEDNYFSLLPGEKREVRGTVRLKDLAGAEPKVAVDGWNVKVNEEGSSADYADFADSREGNYPRKDTKGDWGQNSH